MLPFKTGSLGKSPYLAPQLRAFTKADITPSPLINRNPILHQSNRIVTVGLLSSYNNTQRSFARFSAPPIEKTTPPRSALNAEGAPSAKPEKQEIVADEIEAQQPTFFLFNKKKNGDKILRYRYNSTMKNVYIDFASRAESPETPTKFDWSNKTMVRASLQDLGTLLTVLNGNSSSVEIKKIFKESQTEVLIRLEKDGDDLSVTFTQKKNGSEDQTTKFPLSEADVVLLTEFVRCAVRKGLGFS